MKDKNTAIEVIITIVIALFTICICAIGDYYLSMR